MHVDYIKRVYLMYLITRDLPKLTMQEVFIQYNAKWCNELIRDYEQRDSVMA